MCIQDRRSLSRCPEIGTEREDGAQVKHSRRRSARGFAHSIGRLWASTRIDKGDDHCGLIGSSTSAADDIVERPSAPRLDSAPPLE
jgi:hypothetical protein